MIQNQVKNELIISSDSAEIIAEAFSNYFERTPFIEYVVPVAAIIVSIASIFIARKAYEVSRQNFVSNIQKLYFEIMALFPHENNKPLTDRHKELLTNYIEYVCFLYYQDSLREKDMELMDEIFRSKDHIIYTKKYRKNNKNFYSYYWRWLEENKVV